jgi:hypothetical protein
MRNNSQRIGLLALLLSVVFLAAQFHFCTDLNSGPSGSHICPVCSTAGAAVTPHSLSIGIVPVANRLVISEVIRAISTVLPRAVSTRAPPAL